MNLSLYAHPFSSYCQKVLVALYEHDLPFTLRPVNAGDAAADEEFAERWPMRHMPLLTDGPRSVVEASIIIEYLERYRQDAPPLLPAEADSALQVRFLDRFFDNYVMTPMQRIVYDHVRAEGEHDPRGVADARAMLERSYAWLDAQLAGRYWVAGDAFTLADCAAAPALFYADWVHPIPAQLANTAGYRARLLARPSFARAVDEARPYRRFFPPGAPDRD
ncbi:glutathione S-transferase [Pseudoduganella lurida]|uniref:Glutathione S-transferase n=1 Tax=Pseudoduganella lurida TaxID=1036180 RepID=A0A562QYM2_9BURK|nr:glutathione S-transferase family protein [Pseudoduganella lurida]TWI61905.1 glutathione S-transferase [Pseudoduganella lurida]